ncbi:hypothetical protein ACQZ46_15695 [Agrobacterium salinitolerans]|nr:hypothetical protein [Hyphomicrobiales bacterium]
MPSAVAAEGNFYALSYFCLFLLLFILCEKFRQKTNFSLKLLFLRIFVRCVKTGTLPASHSASPEGTSWPENGSTNTAAPRDLSDLRRAAVLFVRDGS